MIFQDLLAFLLNISLKIFSQKTLSAILKAISNSHSVLRSGGIPLHLKVRGHIIESRR